ncbi:hypothetical protein EDD11_003736 [Mortierella claussenii]|nr:hypothetical protein EDD11_003736 [Mortierella claussenii]
MQFRAMKAEPMDDETFDSSLAMVLDDHLNLMDHLNMIPDGEVYHSTILLPPPIPAFKQEQPETAPQNNYQTHKATVMLPDANTTTTSTFQGVKQATKQNNISSGTGNGGGNNSESMFYYGAPEPMLRPMSATCQDVSFNYTGDNFMQVKVEPGLEQQQQHLQLCQKHTLQISTNSNGGIGSNGPANTRSYSRNDVAYYLTERLHPLDSTSMLQQQNQYEQQQQQYQYQQQFSRNQFEHPVSMLAAEHPFRSQ